MTVAFYLDEHMPRTVAKQLVESGIAVTLAVDVDMAGKDDDTEHMAYAKEHNLVMVTFDRPFAGRTMKRDDHQGLICLSEAIRSDIGQIIRLLSQFAQEHTPDSAAGRVFWLR